MALNPVQRARIIADLLKDGTVTTDANYEPAKVDHLDAPTLTKYVDAFIAVFSPEGLLDSNGDVIPAPTNAQKAMYYLNRLRAHHREVLQANRGPAAGEAARQAALNTAEGEVDTDLGTDERPT